jgi:hypothetical protein
LRIRNAFCTGKSRARCDRLLFRALWGWKRKMTIDEDQIREDRRLSIAILAMLIVFPAALVIGGWAGYKFLGGMFGFMFGFSAFIAVAWVLLSIWRLKNG